MAMAPNARRDYVLTGATVYIDPEQPPVPAAVAVRDGHIAYVGPPSEARQHVADAEPIDLADAVIYPGWTDAHGHLLDYANAQRGLDLRDVQLDEILTLVAQAAAKGVPREWIHGRGWDHNLWPSQSFPTADQLSQAAEDNPVVLTRTDGHAVWVNRAALAAAGITRATPDPPDGRILRDASGAPVGILLENAIRLVTEKIPQPGDAELATLIEEACAECARVGLTGVGDATGYDAGQIAVLRELARSDRLAIRVYATIAADRADLTEVMQAGNIDEGLFTARAVKVYADGALGSRGAALLADYADQPGNRGMLVGSIEYLEWLARQCFRHGWQLWAHALGDAACRTVLDAVQSALELERPADPRPRIEHAQVIDPADVRRFARLGVIASIQPTHATSDMPWLLQRLGWPRIRNAHVWRDLMRAGAKLAGGSDFPIESNDPLLGFYAAVTRSDLLGRPLGGWQPDQRLSARQALCLFTADNAYATFAESRRGRLRVGYDADLTVLDRDVLTIPPNDIPQACVRMTMVAGRIVHHDEDVNIHGA